MSSFKNMKIEINAEQPLHEVVAELERLGFKEDNMFGKPKTTSTVITWSNGTFDFCRSDMSGLVGVVLTTLTELKGMK